MLVGLMILLGLALRIWKAWTGHLSPNSDSGIVGLMAKHMAEGRDFPVFFHGQPYMGNLEPPVSALLCWLFGYSPFLVFLGTALVGTLLLPLVYLWARDAGSRRAGLMALAFCLVGSDTNFHYAVAPRGAYMAMMVTGVLSLWLAARVSTRTRRGRHVPWYAYLGLGLTAGLAWWSTQLAIVFLSASGVILLLGVSRQMVRTGLPCMALGFAAGSLPWWMWNARHAWASFELGGELGRETFAAGFHAVIGQILRLVELSTLTSAWNDARRAVFVGVLCLYLFVVVRDRLRRVDAENVFFRLAAPLTWVLLLLTACTTSHILRGGSSRYVLPLFPAVAVMLGVGCDWLQKRGRFPLGWIVMILLLPKHLYELPRMPRDLVGDRSKWEAASALADEIGPQCDGVAVGSYAYHWINLASGERFCVATLPRERYAPYARRAELAERPAFLGDHGRIGDFLRYTGATGAHANVRGIDVDYRLAPPRDDWRYVEPAAVTEARDTNGKSCRDAVSDGVLDTDWSSLVLTSSFPAVTFAFDRPAAFCGLRILTTNGCYMGRLTVEGRENDAGPWETLLPSTKLTGYFWSGRYAMVEGLQAFQEVRFACPTSVVSQVRITFQSRGEPYEMRLGEILFLERAPPPEGDLPSVGTCVSALRVQGVRRFYAPRWLAARVADAMRGELSVHAPSALFRTVGEVPERDPSLPYPVVLHETTGFAMDVRDAPRSRGILSGAGLTWKETPLGRYVLLVVQQPDRDAEVARYPAFYWTEHGCFAADRGRFPPIPRAELRYRRALRLHAAGETARAVDLLGETLVLYPAHQPARAALVRVLAALGRKEEASAQDAALKTQMVPSVPASIVYPNGIEFLGLNVSAREVEAGGAVAIDYFWKCPPSAAATRLTVFAHFVEGKATVFQDDHNLLDGVEPTELREQPFERIFTEHRRVEIPSSASRGEYRIVIGLYRVKTGERLRPDTALEQDRRAVTLPAVLRIR